MSEFAGVARARRRMGNCCGRRVRERRREVVVLRDRDEGASNLEADIVPFQKKKSCRQLTLR